MKPETPGREDLSSPCLVQRLLLPVFLIGAIGTLGELLLLGHYEEIFQLIPVLLLTTSLSVLALWTIVGKPGTILRVFQLSMLLCLVTGGLGMYLHFSSNVEFELEINPSAAGGELIWDALTGAMPTLAPGSMLQLGLIGLLYTYRHPVFRPASTNTATALERTTDDL